MHFSQNTHPLEYVPNSEWNYWAETTLQDAAYVATKATKDAVLVASGQAGGGGGGPFKKRKYLCCLYNSFYFKNKMFSGLSGC